ncbi:MAG: lantibiotic dehydratase [Gemmataceae bacterium]|nr:lantibiotic dehydratase [Gemmataceae bacterium]
MAEKQSKASFTPSGFFALRTPMLPFDQLLAWGAGLEGCSALEDPARLDKALDTDRARLRERLRNAVSQPEVRDALFVASPSLEEHLPVWLEEPDSERGQKIERSLVKYFARMAGRATPFGLCAGCSVGTLGQETRLELPPRSRYQRHTRLDMDYLVALTEALDRDPALRKTLKYRPNSSLYRSGGRVRYAAVHRNGAEASYCLVGIEYSDYLAATLARAQKGARSQALAATLVAADGEASLDEANEYIGDLIDGQVLVSGLLPGVTGPEPIHDLVAQLTELASEVASAPRGLGALTQPRSPGALATLLDQARTELAALDATGLGVPPERYRAVARRLEELPAKVELKRLFQVDMVKPVEAASLGGGLLAEITRGVELWQRLARRTPNKALQKFREAFVERYQGQDVPERERRWVPLVEALDEEIGIGFDTAGGPSAEASALLEGLTFPPRAEETVPWGKQHTYLLRKLAEALAARVDEIVLEPRDLDELAAPDPAPLPDAFAVLARVAAASEAALDRGDFRVFLGGVSGPSGALLLGRFCHADPELRQHVEAHLRAEEALQPEAVFAEIVHLPEQGRLGNILLRPILRSYEIPYLGRSAVSPDRQIPLTDLLVSVVGDEVVLRSARLGRRVIPRLTSAHNFSRGQAVYRFLCALQGQRSAARWGWDWGTLKEAPFLPRVVCGRLVLSRACWQLDRQELQLLGKGSRTAQFQAVQAWRVQRRLPRWVLLADEDNELPIDLDNVLSVETFVDLVKAREQATLVEMFPGPDELCVRGPEGRFVHELVVPFIRCEDKEPRSQGDKESERDRHSPCLLVSLSPCRSFPPGSEWLYAKLYTGTATADQVLRDVIRPVKEAALESRAADCWFFIRYADPAGHLRVRFHGHPERLREEVFPALQAAVAPFLDDGRIWRVQLDTYEREVERYGGAEAIELAEKIFHADSEAVLALVAILAEDARGDARWRLALYGVARLLEDLGLDGEARRTTMRRVRDAFAKEFRVDAKFKHQLGDKFRQARKHLEALLDSGYDADDALAPGLAVLRRRSEQLAPVIAELRAREQVGRTALSLAEVAPSYVHMHVNRLLRSAQRAHELVLYDYLTRLYEARAARLR